MLDDAKSYDLAPGQQRLRGGKIVGENTRQTYAESVAGAEGKLPPGYVRDASVIDKSQSQLESSILSQRKEAAGEIDPEVRSRLEAEAQRMHRESVSLERKRYAAGIRYGVISPEAEAAQIAPGLRHLDDVNTVLRQARQAGGADWSSKLADALSASGAVQQADGRDRQATIDILETAPDENAVETQRHQRNNGLINGGIRAGGAKPGFATELQLTPLERQQRKRPVLTGLTLPSPSFSQHSRAAARRFG